jgi:hypothetical protein
MTKFFSKDLADNVGYGIATEIAAISVELQTDLARMAAVRKAQGLLSFEQPEAADKAEVRQMIEEGYKLDPDVVTWASEH